MVEEMTSGVLINSRLEIKELKNITYCMYTVSYVQHKA